MHRHSTDLVGLLFGLAFAIAGTGFLLREATGTSVDPAWIAGIGLMLLGAVALVATLARGSHDDPTSSRPAPAGDSETAFDESPTLVDSDG
jgi:drug/metabolite transporter (DMT)-like permease